MARSVRKLESDIEQELERQFAEASAIKAAANDEDASQCTDVAYAAYPHAPGRVLTLRPLGEYAFSKSAIKAQQASKRTSAPYYYSFLGAYADAKSGDVIELTKGKHDFAFFFDHESHLDSVLCDVMQKSVQIRAAVGLKVSDVVVWYEGNVDNCYEGVLLIQADVRIRGITMELPGDPLTYARVSGRLWIESCTLTRGGSLLVDDGGSLFMSNSNLTRAYTSAIQIEAGAKTVVVHDSMILGNGKGYKDRYGESLPGEYGAIELSTWILENEPHHYKVKVGVKLINNTIQSNFGPGVSYRTETVVKYRPEDDPNDLTEGYGITLPSSEFSRAFTLEHNRITGNGVALGKHAPADGDRVVHNTAKRSSSYQERVGQPPEPDEDEDQDDFYDPYDPW